MLGVRNSLLFITLCIVCASAPAVAAPANDVPDRGGRDINTAEYLPDGEECAFLALLNAHRASIGKGPVALSANLGAASRHHSVEMANNSYFSHTMLGGVDSRQNMQNHEYPYAYSSNWGEIIAAGYSDAQNAFQQWYTSTTGHREIMESGKYTAVGVGRGYNETSRYKWYWTAIFTNNPYNTISCDGGTTPAPGTSPTPDGSTRYAIVASGRTSNSVSSRFARDNDASTDWHTAVDSPPSYAYVWFDLGSEKTIGKIRWRFSRTCCADSYGIQVSNDRANWRTISTRSAPGAAGAWITKTWHGEARYIRIYVKNPNGDANIGYISEVQIWSP